MLDVLVSDRVPGTLFDQRADPKSCPIAEPVRSRLLEATLDWFTKEGYTLSPDISPGQPFRLHVLRALLLATEDPDMDLPVLLAEGVPTGCFEPIPASGIWTPLHEPAKEQFLENCEGNWMSADLDPCVTSRLIQEDVDAGFVAEFKGDAVAAKKHWPKGIAIGKLGVAYAEGRDPRLVLDSTAPGVNPSCTIKEKTFLPSLQDLRDASTWTDDCVGLTLDVSKAHKRVKVRPDEQGLLLFEHDGKLFHYQVCHFGATFSAYWWARLSACIHRVLHKLLWVPHFGFIYVDDWLWLLRKRFGHLHASLIVALLTVINCPMSWHKMHIDTVVTWIGFQLHLQSWEVSMPQEKRVRILAFLHDVQNCKKMKRRDIEKGVGLLMWASQAYPSCARGSASSTPA